MSKLSGLIFNRVTVWLAVALAMLLVVVWRAPQLFDVALYKGFLLFAAAHAGYWIDRVVFPYGRPDRFLVDEDLAEDVEVTIDDGQVGYLCGVSMTTQHFDAACLRRAIIIAATMICVGLGA